MIAGRQQLQAGMGRCKAAHVRVGELAASVPTLAGRSHLSGVLVGLPGELQSG